MSFKKWRAHNNKQKSTEIFEWKYNWKFHVHTKAVWQKSESQITSQNLPEKFFRVVLLGTRCTTRWVSGCANVLLVLKTTVSKFGIQKLKIHSKKFLKVQKKNEQCETFSFEKQPQATKTTSPVCTKSAGTLFKSTRFFYVYYGCKCSSTEMCWKRSVWLNFQQVFMETSFAKHVWQKMSTRKECCGKLWWKGCKIGWLDMKFYFDGVFVWQKTNNQPWKWYHIYVSNICLNYIFMSTKRHSFVLKQMPYRGTVFVKNIYVSMKFRNHELMQKNQIQAMSLLTFPPPPPPDSLITIFRREGGILIFQI